MDQKRAKKRGRSLTQEFAKKSAERIQMACKASWQVSLPEPQTAHQYEEILSGTFERILKMQEVRNLSTCTAILSTAQTNEKFVNGQINTIQAAQLYDFREARRGQWLGSILCITAMLLGVYMTLKEHEYLGGFIVAIPVVSVCLALIKDNLRLNSERND